MGARVLMVQGTASSVGKSLVAAALCRLFRRRGVSVAPFKAQNMSNNAAAVPGGEIGRAQALQAAAAGVEPCVDMNPVLVKPEADSRAQVVLLGRPYRTLSAGDYNDDRDRLWAAASAALDRLSSRFDLIVAEGAGSPAEINLMDRDIANMAVARYANAPVILVADIDPGGMFAQVVGTLALLEPEDRARVAGFVVNKFRGERALLEPGLDELRRITGLPILGVLPYLHGLGLAEEDGVALERGPATRPVGATARKAGAAGRTADTAVRRAGAARGGPSADYAEEGRKLDIAVLRLPRISNFDDFDPLLLEEGVSLRYIADPAELGLPDALILPGTKATLDDLEWLRSRGFDDGIRWLARLGRSVAGVCGGYQMLGEWIDDSAGIEGPPRRLRGLGLLPVATRFVAGKSTSRRRGTILGGPGFFAAAAGERIEGYEIHSGVTEALASAGTARTKTAAMAVDLLGRAPAQAVRSGPWDEGAMSGILELEAGDGRPSRADGAAAMDGHVWGSYLHGIFDQPGFRRAWLASLGAKARGSGVSMAEARERALDRLADAFGAALDMDAIERLAGLR